MSDDDEDMPPSKRRAYTDPHIDVEQMLDDMHPIRIHQSGMMIEEMLEVVEEVHADFFLDTNQEQSRAFRIAAEHFVFSTMEQMLLFITGMGGTGKSHIIKAIIALFKQCGCPENLLLSAPTGSAAILIDGYTIHALTFLPGKDETNKQSELELIWGKVRYLILDKISMVSAELLCQISKRIAIGKRADPNLLDKPFGGVNVIFAGDLGQLRPVGNASLFSADLLRRCHAHMKETKKVQNTLFGASIWRQLTHIVELKENVRAREDHDYAAHLLRMRKGNGTLHATDGPSDYDVLQSRVLENLQRDKPFEYALLRDAPVVFGQRRLRDLYNEFKAKEYAQRTGKQLHYYLAVDKIKKNRLQGEQRLRVCQIRCKDGKEALGRLPLIVRMPVMITENLSMQNKIVNGSEGVVKKIIYRTSDEGREAVCVHVHIRSSPITLEGLTPGIVPIFPRSVSFDCKSQQGTRIKISRTQLPLLPTWAFTDYKVQGASLNTVIVDLASARACNMHT